MKMISGNTYPVKDQLRAMGGRWNPENKAWMIPDDRAEDARRLVAAAPATHTHHTSYHCSCNQSCCRPRCTCGSRCNCRGGNIYDC